MLHSLLCQLVGPVLSFYLFIITGVASGLAIFGANVLLK